MKKFATIFAALLFPISFLNFATAETGAEVLLSPLSEKFAERKKDFAAKLAEIEKLKIARKKNVGDLKILENQIANLEIEISAISKKIEILSAAENSQKENLPKLFSKQEKWEILKNAAARNLQKIAREKFRPPENFWKKFWSLFFAEDIFENQKREFFAEKIAENSREKFAEFSQNLKTANENLTAVNSEIARISNLSADLKTARKNLSIGSAAKKDLLSATENSQKIYEKMWEKSRAEILAAENDLQNLKNRAAQISKILAATAGAEIPTEKEI